MQDSITYCDIVKDLTHNEEFGGYLPIHKLRPSKEGRFKVGRELTRFIKTIEPNLMNLSIFSGNEKVIDLNIDIFKPQYTYVEFKFDEAILNRFFEKKDRILKDIEFAYRVDYPYEDFDVRSLKFTLFRGGETYHFLTVENSFHRYQNNESFTMTVNDQSHRFW